jgi:hypothetical protein
MLTVLGVNASATCDGEIEGVITVQCPYYITQPACADLYGSDFSVSACSVSSFNGNATACDCVVNK